uniref:REF/SRPP-like protein At1g67360 n=1 Tax=Rhizophora mucronata TaxID=61149 RepID=A0A2P2IZ93_RHIMU
MSGEIGEMEIESKNQGLKHLGFVRIAAIHALACMSSLYEYAKQNSGPLRSVVGTVEGAVTTVVGPVCQKFKGAPDDLLVFLDKKVDEATIKFDEHAPPLAKQVVGQTRCFVEKASHKGQELVNDARTGGPRAAMHHVVSESKHFALCQSVKIWTKLDQYPAVHTVAEVAIPTAAHWSEKYNHFVQDMTQKGYTVFGYVPLVPLDEISKSFKQGEAEKEEDATAVHSNSDSD